ncbi:hypothetical protein DPMN_180886 [Dreissena polymorpha]|uniref:Uncharacterized protein n=1 Tax=Dreissena polymorpha TaxID=45954 RepID=A0A9D4DCG8_DREPO|nr:hypothetical protein DPMN_180886 [Dreissena polymorpha]
MPYKREALVSSNDLPELGSNLSVPEFNAESLNGVEVRAADEPLVDVISALVDHVTLNDNVKLLVLFLG